MCLQCQFEKARGLPAGSVSLPMKMETLDAHGNSQLDLTQAQCREILRYIENPQLPARELSKKIKGASFPDENGNVWDGGRCIGTVKSEEKKRKEGGLYEKLKVLDCKIVTES